MIFINLTGQEVIVTYAILGISILIGVYIYRAFVRNQKIKKSDKPTASIILLSSRTKYPEKNILRHRSRIFGIGIAFSMIFSIVAMSWTVYELELAPEIYIPIDEISEVSPPRTPPPAPPPPPPPPPVVQPVDDEILEEQPEFLNTDIEPDELVIPPPPPPAPTKPTPKPPLPPMPESIEDDLPFKIVEKMPMFGDCSDKMCSDKALLTYIYKHIKYPGMAREIGVEGRVTAEFVIERDGSLSGLKILRGIGAGCDAEVLKVLETMDKGRLWSAGEQRGKKVRVLYRLPVTYKLDQ